MRFLQRLTTLVRIELGHALLGKLEEHRFKLRSRIRYQGPIEALKVIKAEQAAIALYKDHKWPEYDKAARGFSTEYQPMDLSRKRYRKDMALFL
jgi:hypothetical protein